MIEAQKPLPLAGRIAFAKNKGVVMALLAALGFSAKAVFVKLGYRYGAGAEALLVLRMAFALPFFLLMAWRSGVAGGARRLERRDWQQLALLGLLGYYLSSLLDFIGLQYVSAALERLTLFLYPTLVLFISVLWLGKRYPAKVWLGVGLAYLGIALAFVQDLRDAGLGSQALIGLAWVVASTVSYALYLVGSGEAIARIGATRFAALATLVACLAVFVHFAVTTPLTALLLPMPVYLIGFAMGVFSTVLPVWCLNVAIRQLGAGKAASVGTLGPVLTMAMGWLVLGESLTGVQVLGAALVIGGVGVVGRSK
ncbi:EamA-like transporter family protein [Pseudogulbenkiania sp. NH8B]|uniref:DMT family transporter n=1 Tax=Pseudogulbenkiania sp. (strain NH8B) TaxID=748280 RepID=UPI0002279D1F|nr:DMT family transporter [Pseudogulbenkiania sp. NH8B]BAK77662.1 EamA-like transporter family protein [Pseudogulbenkiania sp. NH8B]